LIDLYTKSYLCQQRSLTNLIDTPETRKIATTGMSRTHFSEFLGIFGEDKNVTNTWPHRVVPPVVQLQY